MKVYSIIAICSIVFIYATCSPVYINYHPSNNKNQRASRDTVELNSGNQQLTFSILQEHFPFKKVQNVLFGSLQNFTSDTLFSVDSIPFIQIVSEANSIDSVRLYYVLQQQQKYILPNSSFELKES